MTEGMSKQDTTEGPNRNELITLTSEMVAAYVANNATTASDLPDLIGAAYGTLSSLGTPSESEVEQKPAVPVKVR